MSDFENLLDTIEPDPAHTTWVDSGDHDDTGEFFQAVCQDCGWCGNTQYASDYTATDILADWSQAFEAAREDGFQHGREYDAS